MNNNRQKEKIRKQLYQLVGEYYKLTRGKEVVEEGKELVVVENKNKPFLIVFTEA